MEKPGVDPDLLTPKLVAYPLDNDAFRIRCSQCIMINGTVVRGPIFSRGIVIDGMPVECKVLGWKELSYMDKAATGLNIVSLAQSTLHSASFTMSET